MNDKAQGIITALKACAEMCGIFMNHLEKQGFSRKEALTLTQSYLQATLTPKSKEEK